MEGEDIKQAEFETIEELISFEKELPEGSICGVEDTSSM